MRVSVRGLKSRETRLRWSRGGFLLDQKRKGGAQAPPLLFSPGFPDAHKTKPSKEKLSRVLKGEPDSDLLSPEIQPTIIGARAFHRPVRNGKGWGHSAMAVRQRLCFQSFLGLLKRILWEGMKSHGLLFHIHTFLSFCKLPFKTFAVI